MKITGINAVGQLVSHEIDEAVAAAATERARIARAKKKQESDQRHHQPE